MKKKKNTANKDIPQCNSLSLLGITFQRDCKFSEHVKLKLTNANRCLYVLRTLRRERYTQKEIDLLFKSIILPNITYGLSVYGASEPDLKIVQRFLDRCYKRRYTSQSFSIYELLKKHDLRICNRVTALDNHPLHRVIP